jgi:hypothetical protein
MEFSDKAKILLEKIEKHSGKKIKNFDDIGVLFDLSEDDNEKIFEDLIFTAKYLKGLSAVLNKEIDSEASRTNLTKEFQDNLALFVKYISDVIDSGNVQIKEEFQKKYFDVKPEILFNLFDLINDLTLVKNYYNDQKYN